MSAYPDDVRSAEQDLRDLMKHETEQVHRRLSWLGSLQGFLFATLGLAWGKNGKLLLVVELLGFSVAVLVFAGFIASAIAQLRIHRAWVRIRPADYDSVGIFPFFPTRAMFTVFTAPEVLMPLLFVSAWLAIMFIGTSPVCANGSSATAPHP